MGTSGIGNSCCCSTGTIRIAVRCGTPGSTYDSPFANTIPQFHNFSDLPIPTVDVTGPLGFHVTTNEIDAAGNYVVHISKKGSYHASISSDPYWFNTSVDVTVTNEFIATLAKMNTCLKRIHLVETPIGCSWDAIVPRLFPIPGTEVSFTGPGGSCSYSLSESGNDGCFLDTDSSRCGGATSIGINPPSSSGFLDVAAKDMGLIACMAPDATVYDRTFMPSLPNTLCIGNVYPILTPLRYSDDGGSCELTVSSSGNSGTIFGGSYVGNFPSFTQTQDCDSDGRLDNIISSGDLQCLVFIQVTIIPLDDYSCEVRVLRTIGGTCVLYDNDCNPNFNQWRQISISGGLGSDFLNSTGVGMTGRRYMTSFSVSVPYQGPGTVFFGPCGYVDTSGVRGISGTATIIGS